MTDTTKQSNPSREELLKEYEFCQDSAQSMESTIWQTGAAMSLGLIGLLLINILRGATDQPPWYLACLVGPFLAAIASVWWLVARRWWSVQHAMFMRMRHIERQLGLHSVWYVQYLDDPGTIPASGLNEAEMEDLRKRSASHDRLGIKRHQHWGVQASLWLLPVVLISAWACYAFVLMISQVAGFQP